MMKRFTDVGLFTSLVLVWTCVAARASDLRETPVVRAVKRAGASVVNIYTEKSAAAGDALFTTGKSRKVNGMGTGILIDERGYLVTNHHVVLGVDSLKVQLADGSSYMGEVVSYDKGHDLALVRIHASRPLAVLPLGTSSDLMLGETVIAIGNAFGYDHTITVGIVSALSRDVEVNEEQSYENLIQTDASINPGNSGGPLVNLDGEVVGINVAIRAGAQRIGFAIPMDDARRIIARLIAAERGQRTWHGLVTSDVKAGADRKLVVAAVQPDSPALQAGFRSGDVVLQAGSVAVIDGADLERAVLEAPAGQTVAVVVRRDGADETLTLRLAESRGGAETRDQAAVVRANNDDGGGDPVWKSLGLKLNRLAGADDQLSGSRYRGGMRVLAVRPNSPAATNGIKTGDVLVGLHIWETVNEDNIQYVLTHPQLASFNPLKFYIIRNRETLFGHLQVASREQ